jgi:exopolysaccharide production protein ExoQ
MPTMEPIAETPHPPSRTAMVWLTIVVLTAAFYCVEHRNTQVSTMETFASSTDEMVERMAEGDASRRVGILAIGLFGAILLVRRDGRRLELRSLLGWLLLGYTAWCGMSILWSDDPSLTVRHFSALVLCGLGTLGIARHVPLRDLCLVALVVTTILVFNSVCTELVLGTFRPFSLDYRFAGTLHPNCQAPYCATMALAAGFLAGHTKRGRTLLWTLCVIGAVLLVLTKSRTACGTVAVGLLAYGSLTAAWPKIVAIIAAILSACCAFGLVVSLLGGDVERQISNVVLIGRQEEADSLSGRVPLWGNLLPYAQDNILLGHGFETFWTPQRIDRVSNKLGWAIPDAHNAYLDTLLELGVIGVALSLAVIFTGVRETLRGFLSGGGYGYAFLFTLLVYRALNGMLESSLLTPTGAIPFLMACGLAHLAFCGEVDKNAAAVESPKEAGQ